jgi:riboflavin synthase
LFTGIVEEVGSVAEVREGGFRIRARLVMDDLKVADSVCVNGTCLTVTERGDDWFTVDAVPETLRLTNLGDLREGHPVNLERALLPSTRMGGHFVQGHIEGTATVDSIEPDGEAWMVRFSAPANLMRYIVHKGFVTIDGASLTVVSRDEAGFAITIIPFTYANTVFRSRKPGDRVNIEPDILAKYVEQVARASQ